MRIKVKIAGSYQDVSGVSVKKSGAYQDVAGMFAKINGSFRSLLLQNVEAELICSRMTSLESSPTASRAALIDSTVSALKAAGLFSLLGDLRIFAAHSAVAAQVNWITPSDAPATLVNSPEMTADRGLRTDGITSFISLGRPPNDIPGYTQDDASIGLFVREAGAAQNTAIGATSGRVALIQPRTSGGNFVGRINASASVTFGAVVARTGLFVVSRQTGGHVSGYRNGELVSTQASTSSATAQTTNVNVGLDSGAYSDDQYSAVVVGRGLTAQNVSDLNAILGAYMTAVGA